MPVRCASDRGVLLTVHEVAEVLEATGFRDPVVSTVQVVEDFGWSHPDWFWGCRLTVCGSGFVGLSGGGLVFREAGVRVVLDQYGSGQ